VCRGSPAPRGRLTSERKAHAIRRSRPGLFISDVKHSRIICVMANPRPASALVYRVPQRLNSVDIPIPPDTPAARITRARTPLRQHSEDTRGALTPRGFVIFGCRDNPSGSIETCSYPLILGMVTHSRLDTLKYVWEMGQRPRPRQPTRGAPKLPGTFPQRPRAQMDIL
jgi:hypothetical protein